MIFSAKTTESRPENEHGETRVTRQHVNIRQTAIHEAGHAVAAFLLREKIKYVTIRPTQDSHGHMMHHVVRFARNEMFDDSLRGRDRAERRIMTCFAGQIAQRKHAPRSRWRLGGSHDHEQAMELFFHIDPPDQKARELYLALLWRQTEYLVEQHWKEIEAVAAALLEEETLSRDRTREVIYGARGVTLK